MRSSDKNSAGEQKGQHSPLMRELDRPAGVCIPWEQKRAQLAEINGDPELFERIWGEVDQLPYLYIWYCLLAF